MTPDPTSAVSSWPLTEPVGLLGEQLPQEVTPTVAMRTLVGVVKSRARTDTVVNVWTNGARSTFTLAAPDDSSTGRAVRQLVGDGVLSAGADIVVECSARPVEVGEVAAALSHACADSTGPAGDADRLGQLTGLCGWETDGLVLARVDTGPRHVIADRELAARADDCAKAAASLGLTSLAEAGLDATVRCDEPLRPLVRHVVTERARIHRVESVLRRGDWAQFGQLLTSSHASLRDDLAVSTPELDRTVDGLIGAGALGARLSGPGFGGHVIALVRTELTRKLDLEVVRASPLRTGPVGGAND